MPLIGPLFRFWGKDLSNLIISKRHSEIIWPLTLGKIKPISEKLRGKVIVTEPWPKNPELKSKLEEIIVKLGGIVEQSAKDGITWAYIQTGIYIYIL